jgi:hypothetical protein
LFTIFVIAYLSRNIPFNWVSIAQGIKCNIFIARSNCSHFLTGTIMVVNKTYLIWPKLLLTQKNSIVMCRATI